jgi:hypothetical protein
MAARCETCRLAAPERRARREREQRGEVREQPVHDLDRLVGVVDRDVDVHPEDQLPPRDVLELVDQRVVPVRRRDPLPLEEAVRMRPGRPHPQAVLSAHVPDVAPKRRELAHHVSCRRADRRGDLEDGLHQLGVDALGECVALDRVEHRLDVLDEVEALGVEQHVLLLDAERVGLAVAEAVVDDARGRDALEAGDRGRDDLLHGRTASASISTIHASSSRRATTHVAAGRVSRKASPCARATSSQCAGSVT